ncbi:MAG: hypothetical protein AB1798_14140 [Spirochaetota bacterium]
MVEQKPTVSSSLLEAMEDYAAKIEKITTHDPGNKVELACLYSGISGINECVTALKKNGFISDSENEKLQKEIHKLYAMLRFEDRS